MQPYFFPYAGYFRLLAAADELVVYDCVQFPRRGRVHRCRVPGPSGAEEWLTLPLRRHPRSTLIRELRFAEGARQELDRRLDRLPWIGQGGGPQADRIRAHLRGPLDDVTDFLVRGLDLVRDLLGFGARMRRSSDLDVDPARRGQDRILAICEAVGARHYLNAPGGRDLYDAQAFADRGVHLQFLPEYRGPHFLFLPALLRVPAAELREDVLASLGMAADRPPEST
jgi:hypothetical protein